MTTEAQLLYADALAWAQARKIVLPADYYGPAYAKARAKAFSIAGLSALDEIESVFDHLNSALTQGSTFANWKSGLLTDPKALQALLLGQARLDNIFRTNLLSAYMAGIAKQQEAPANVRRRPYFQYDAINDSRTRPTHTAMDNFIAPATDPVWQRWTPPAGYRCRCTRIALTEKEAIARGWKGVAKAAPAEPDTGWGEHPLAGGEMAGLRKAVDKRSAKYGGMWDQSAIQAALAEVRRSAFSQPQTITPAVYDLSAPRVLADVSTPARAKAVEIEDTIRGNALETGIFIDQSGAVLKQKQGQPDRVAFLTSDLQKMSGALFTHNHPGGSSFSFEDIALAAEFALSEIRAVTVNARHIAKPINQWPDLSALTLAEKQAIEKQATALVRDMVNSDQLDASRQST